MKTKILLHLSLALSLLCAFIFLATSIALAQEQVTITTYYPAPYGIYKELRADQMAVGSTYRTSALSDGNLIVSGNVGIGTPTPHGSKFEVNMGNNNDFFCVNTDTNIGLELRSGTTGGTPYIDFSNNATSDYTERIILNSSGGLTFTNLSGNGALLKSNGDINSTGLVTVYRSATHPNGCIILTYGSNSGTTTCPPGTAGIDAGLSGPASPVGGIIYCCY